MKKSILLFLAFIAFVSSCRKFKEEEIVAKAEPFRPVNIYPVERLPLSFTRVAMLPCHYPDADSSILDFCDQIFYRELSQERIFEIVTLSTDDINRLFGVKRLPSTARLPSNFLKIIERETAANGVLFLDLDSYKPFRPMSLGVRAKLVDLKTGEFMWAIDETFDAAHANVIAGATQYQQDSHVRALSERTKGSVLHSPRNFTKYIASTIFRTLPKR